MTAYFRVFWVGRPSSCKKKSSMKHSNATTNTTAPEALFLLYAWVAGHFTIQCIVRITRKKGTCIKNRTA